MPLHILCNQFPSNSELEMARLILSSGLNPNLQDNLGRTAIHCLIRRLHWERMNNRSTVIDVTLTRGFQLLKLLIQYGVYVNLQDLDGRTPVHLCAFYNIVGLVPTIIPIVQMKIDLEIADVFGNTPLHIAADYCHLGFLQELVSLDANPGFQNGNSETALHLVAKNFLNRGVECATFLVSECKVDVNQRDDRNGRTPLHIACLQSRNRDRMVSTLIDLGADPNIADDTGETPLTLYLQNHLSILQEYLHQKRPLADVYGISNLGGYIDHLHGLNSMLNEMSQVNIGALQDINNISFEDKFESKLVMDKLLHRGKNPSSLQFICRCCIRRILKGKNISRSLLTSLELTNPVIDIILLPLKRITLAVEYNSHTNEPTSPFFLWSMQGSYRVTAYTWNQS
ncbi:ankyrin-1-like [Anneissia japonica]|uniref:ankyrin-1-like n=1 Tax=Anneissia japonica TaxID=1529436 RepID=UPI0014255700|nr:ankyrin-1-like [Anneissia japonica]